MGVLSKLFNSKNLADSASFGHRPWPIPPRPWTMMQVWRDLLFMHWPIAAERMRALVPAQLPLDLYQGQAWMGVVPFRMSGIRLRGTPVVPGLSAFPELNVRTYVTVNGKPGVYFFSLDAGNPIAVQVARRWFHLPYYWARMSLVEKNGDIHYRSVRRKGETDAALVASYRPTGPAVTAAAGSLAYWLTERYCLYTLDQASHVLRGEIAHPPWPLQPAEVSLQRHSMTGPLGLELPATSPLLHFSRRQDVLIWSLERV